MKLTQASEEQILTL